MERFQVRQGDILIEAIDPWNNRGLEERLEKGVAMEKGRTVTLLEGEATGHAHQIIARKAGEVAELFEEDGRRYVRVPEDGADLVHPEHASIPFDTPGVYEVFRQDVFTGQGRVNVLD